MKLYFMGICGTAMGNAALLARAAGHEVLGADSGVYPPMSRVLADAGIVAYDGYDPARLERLAPDCVVIGNAMSRGNPEVEWLLDSRALPFTSLPAMLHTSILCRRRNIVVAGTHGKTTTTAITAFLLREGGGDPGFLIGGVPQDPPTGAHLGSDSDPFVIEGDEYDSAFFDKRSKFIHYAPHIAVLNNLEFDHADIFRDLADVQRTFIHFSRIVPRNGWVVRNGDDRNLDALGSMAWTRVVRVGVGTANDVRIDGFEEFPSGSSFRLVWKGHPWATVTWSLTGLFNARNAAMASVAVALSAAGPSSGEIPAVPPPVSFSALGRFRGVRRRQEVLASGPRITVIEDFGHHPTALAETLASFRLRFPGAVLAAAFEPRSNTARARVMQNAFLEALATADEIYLGPVSRAEQLGSDERFDGPAVARSLVSRGRRAESFANNQALFERLVEGSAGSAAGGGRRVVVFFSNGSFDGIVAKFAAIAQAVA